MKKYMITVEINGLFDHEVKAKSMEEAIQIGRQMEPSDVIKLKSLKRSGVQDWEVRGVTSVWEA